MQKVGWVRMTAVRVSGAIETPAAHFEFEGYLRAGTHLTVYDLRCEGRGGAIWKWPSQAGEAEKFSVVLEQEGESLFGRLVIEAITQDERLFRIETHPPPGRAFSR